MVGVSWDVTILAISVFLGIIQYFLKVRADRRERWARADLESARDAYNKFYWRVYIKLLDLIGLYQTIISMRQNYGDSVHHIVCSLENESVIPLGNEIVQCIDDRGCLIEPEMGTLAALTELKAYIQTYNSMRLAGEYHIYPEEVGMLFPQELAQAVEKKVAQAPVHWHRFYRQSADVETYVLLKSVRGGHTPLIEAVKAFTANVASSGLPKNTTLRRAGGANV